MLPVINFTDVVTLQGLLLYIYSDRVVRVSGKLLEAAVAFDLPRLVSTCLVHLPGVNFTKII